MQTDKKKEYDKGYVAKRYDAFRERKDTLHKDVFGGCCFLCGATQGWQSFHLHHREYHPEESAYARDSHSLWTRINRVAEAEAHPERFRLLCNACHRLITNFASTAFLRITRLRNQPDFEKFMDLITREMLERKVDYIK